jgi:hypothetical protein
MKYWEIIADNLHNAGWSLGWVSALDVEGRTIWIADAHRGELRSGNCCGENDVAPQDEVREKCATNEK